MPNTIDLMGVLNSITKDKTLAKAEQIEITLYDGTKRKIPAEMMNYVKGMTADQIIAFLAVAQDSAHPITDDYLFICTESVILDYEVGHIYYYDGSTQSIADITPATGGGGSGSTSSVRIQVTAPTEEISANTPFDITYNWVSKNTGYGLVYCLVDGTMSARNRMQPGAGTWTLTNGLSRGTHTLTIYAVDSGGISSEQWTKQVTVGNLAIESTFNEQNIYTLGSRISIPYIYYTNDADYTNELIVTVDDAAPITVAAGTQGIQLIYVLSSLAAGNHVVKMKVRSYKMKTIEQEIEGAEPDGEGNIPTEQVEVLDVEKYSNELSLHILVAAYGVLYADISGSDTFSIKEREKVTLTVRTTYIGATSFTATLEAYRKVGDEWVLDNTKYASDAIWYNGLNSFIITNITTAGEYKFIVRVVYSPTNGNDVYPEVDPTFYVHVEEADTLHINSVVDESLLLHLSATGKSNSSLDKNVWLDTSKQEILAHNPNADVEDRDDANVTLTNFNYTSNGWLPDANGQTRLLINGGAYAEIDLEPFAEEIDKGLTFDIEFATEDILDASARVVSCFDGTRGFWIDTENATLSNNNSKLEKITTATEVTNSNIILRYDNKLVNGEYVYIDNVTGLETSEPETNGVANEHATVPVYMTYMQYTQTGPFQTNFPSNEKTRITFVIQRGERALSGEKDFGDYQMSCMCIYVNGVLTSIEKITDYTDLIGVQFENGGKKITLGCDNDYEHKGKAEIYNIRLYNRALSMEEVLTNYISDIEDPIEQNDMIRRNALLGTTSQDLPVMEFYFTESDWASLSKENKMYGRVTFTNFDGTTENFDKHCRCQWQG